MQNLPPLADVPPGPSTIEISVLGPGYGESVVVHLGDGRWMVVDSCRRSPGISAPLEYLQDLGVDVATQVDLVVATHWHDDHIRGLASLVSAASNATVCASAALGSTEFLALTGHQPTTPSAWSSGVTELHEVEASLRRDGRSSIRLVSSDQMLLRTPGRVVSEVWALSPSPDDQNRAIQHLGALYPDGLRPGRRVQILPPNDTAVALLLVTADRRSILLGSDLEHHPDSEARGWHAVLAGTAREGSAAAFWKVAHHGGRSGYCERIWTEMLAPEALSVVTPFQRGAQDLPTPDDVRTLLTHTPRAYITSDRRARPVRRERAAQKSIDEGTRVYRPYNLTMGHVQVRLDDEAIQVRGSDEARQLS